MGELEREWGGELWGREWGGGTEEENTGKSEGENGGNNKGEIGARIRFFFLFKSILACRIKAYGEVMVRTLIRAKTRPV